jgi:hypothetical protein
MISMVRKVFVKLEVFVKDPEEHTESWFERSKRHFYHGHKILDIDMLKTILETNKMLHTVFLV